MFVNSGAGINASPGLASYTASKFALRGFADSLRNDEPSLRVTSVHPGRIATEMQEGLVAYEGRDYDPAQFLSPETVAKVIADAVNAAPRRPHPRGHRPPPVICGRARGERGLARTIADELDGNRRAVLRRMRDRKGLGGLRAVLPPRRDLRGQTDALAEVDTLEAYTEWMKGLLTPLPDGTAELKSFAVDEARQNVTAFAVFPGRTPATADRCRRPASAAVDYVYVMEFDGDKIRHMTKIWNDGITMRQLGWAAS